MLDNQSVSAIEKAFASKIQPVGEAETLELFVPVEISSVMHSLTDVMFDALSISYYKGDLPFSSAELISVADYLIEARACYVSGIIKCEVHPRDVVYPSIFGPVLAALGQYRNDVTNVVITPVPAKLVDEVDGKYVAKKGVRCKAPECYERVMGFLRVMGVPVSYGLPMDKRVSSDDFFRVEVADETLKGTMEKAPSPVTLFSRVLVEMSYLENLYGSARVTYAAVGSLRLGIRDLVLQNLDGIRGR